MTDLQKITEFCAKLLDIENIEDHYCENGLQVEGKKEIKKIALGVTASENFLKKSAHWGADMCIVHHGLFWKGGVSKITGPLKNRLKILLENNISLLNFHLPLDAHGEIGNNILLAKIFALENVEKVDIGYVGNLPKKISFEEFVKEVESKLGEKVKVAEKTSNDVYKVGIISGGAGNFANLIKNAGVDTFLLGEVSEPDYHNICELGLSFIAAGHFVTEKYGVQSLGKKIQEEFSDFQIQFIDEYCPV